MFLQTLFAVSAAVAAFSDEERQEIVDDYFSTQEVRFYQLEGLAINQELAELLEHIVLIGPEMAQDEEFGAKLDLERAEEAQTAEEEAQKTEEEARKPEDDIEARKNFRRPVKETERTNQAAKERKAAEVERKAAEAKIIRSAQRVEGKNNRNEEKKKVGAEQAEMNCVEEENKFPCFLKFAKKLRKETEQAEMRRVEEEKNAEQAKMKRVEEEKEAQAETLSVASTAASSSRPLRSRHINGPKSKDFYAPKRVQPAKFSAPAKPAKRFNDRKQSKQRKMKK